MRIQRFFVLLLSATVVSTTPAAPLDCPFAKLVSEVRDSNTQSARELASGVRTLEEIQRDPSQSNAEQLRKEVAEILEKVDQVLERHLSLKDAEAPSERSADTMAEEMRIHDLANAAIAAKNDGAQILEMIARLQGGEPLPNGVGERIGQLLESTQRLREIASRDPSEVSISETDLSSFLNRALKVAKARREEGLEIEVEGNFPAEVGTARMDEILMLRVVENLATNAGRHAFKGREGGKLTVSADHIAEAPKEAPENTTRVGEVKPDQAYFVLEVKDNGGGMEASTRERIFEAGVTENAGKGRGLGLASVAEAAKTHGGFVEVTSSPGEGTSFKVHIPIESLPNANAKNEFYLDPATTPKSEAQKIVIIDDTRSASFVPNVLLKKNRPDLGSNTFLSAKAAIENFQENGLPKIAIVDLQMPGELPGGAQGYIKGLQRSGVTVIISSGATETPAELRAEFGVDYVLPKPMDARDLIATVKAAEEGREQPAFAD